MVAISHGRSSTETDTEVADQTTTKPTIRVSVAIVEAHQPTRDHLVTLLGNGGTPFGSMADLAGLEAALAATNA